MTKQEIAEMLADSIKVGTPRSYEVNRYLKMSKPMLVELLEAETAPTKEERNAAYRRFADLASKRAVRRPVRSAR